MSDHNQSDLTFSRVLQVRAGTPDETLLKLAKKRALDETIFDEFAPSFFRGEISSNRWDAYLTRMAPSSLKNYAEDATAGVSVLRNHDTGADPIGQSLTGQFIGGSGDGVARVESDFYLLTDPETLPYVRKLRAGVVRDISVGFIPGEFICSICHKDMGQWMSRDGCPHLLGMEYTPVDEAGKQKGEPVVARATIENARLAEYSCVYDGATPGAMLKKARGMAAEGLLSDEERGLVQVRYRLQLPDARRSFPGADLTDVPADPPGTGREATLPKEEHMADDQGRQTPDAAQERLSALTLRFTQHGMPADADPEQWSSGELTRMRPLETQVRALCEKDEAPEAALVRLARQAQDGTRYREDLVTEALGEGVRACGADFDKATYEPLLRTADLAVVKRMRDDWRKVGDVALPGGRVTQDEPGEKPAASRSHPPGAYAA
jgi:hypothetical protein